MGKPWKTRANHVVRRGGRRLWRIARGTVLALMVLVLLLLVVLGAGTLAGAVSWTPAECLRPPDGGGTPSAVLSQKDVHWCVQLDQGLWGLLRYDPVDGYSYQILFLHRGGANVDVVFGVNLDDLWSGRQE